MVPGLGDRINAMWLESAPDTLGSADEETVWVKCIFFRVFASANWSASGTVKMPGAASSDADTATITDADSSVKSLACNAHPQRGSLK